MKPIAWCMAARPQITNWRETQTSMPPPFLVLRLQCLARTLMTLELLFIRAIKTWRVRTSPYLIPAAESLAVPLMTSRLTMNSSSLGEAAVPAIVITLAGIRLSDTARPITLEACCRLTTSTSLIASVTKNSASANSKSSLSATHLPWMRFRLTFFRKRKCLHRMLHLTVLWDLPLKILYLFKISRLKDKEMLPKSLVISTSRHLFLGKMNYLRAV